MQLNDTAAIVTGAASGLGGATAKALASKGATVFGLDLADAIAAGATLPGVTYVPVDVTDASAVNQAIEATSTSERPLRLVVNCAGIAPSARVVNKRGSHDAELFSRVIQVNLVGTFNVLSAAAAKMSTTKPLEDGQRGVIINTASIAAYDGQIGQAAYASSKGGIVALTLPAARDLAQYGIRVLAIAPGIMDTPMLATVPTDFRDGLAAGVPFPQRLGRAEEYAELALALIDHDYLNGEVVRMDGALRMAPR